MTDVNPIVRRTPSERRAYLDGIDAGIKMVEREVKRGLLGTDALRQASESARLVRDIADREDAD